MTAQRKLVCILAADVAGYSRLMADDEQATERTLSEYRQVFTEHVVRHRGHVVDTAGDSVLAVLESPVEAVECAGEIQRELIRRNRQLAEHRRMQVRIGLNLGDIVTRDDGTIYGDGVNIAARLQAIAEPGGICVSTNVFEQVDGRLQLEFTDLGEHQVKNIAKPVRAYKVLLRSDAPRQPVASTSGRRGWRTVIGAGLVVVAVAALTTGIWLWRDLHYSPESARPRHLSDKPSIAVLAFENISGDPKQEYLSDGITEDIITGLARFTKLSVVARNSTLTYKGKAVDVRQVGKEMGARYVLEGSVRRSGDRARITAQLIDASDGKHIWAESYDRELKDIFSVQDEVTRQIVGRLDVELDRAQLEQAKRSSLKDFRAYDLVLQARKQIYDHSEANHRESRDLLERAIAMDDKLAAAYIELAWIYLDEFRFGWNARPDPLDRALRAASRAVELEPNNGFAHWRLAKILFFRKELDRFESERLRAVSLNPNHAETLADVGFHLSILGREEEGYEYAVRAVQLDPNLTFAYFIYTWYFYKQGRYREALAATQQINMPQLYWTHFWRAALHAELGEMDAAHKEAAEVLRLKPDFAFMEEAQLWNMAKGFRARGAEGARKAGIPVSRTHKP
jgi:adenylate cyclase